MNNDWSQYYKETLPIDKYLQNVYAHTPLFKEILKTKPAEILEVGVGTGDMSLLLASLGFNVSAVDSNKNILQTARGSEGHIKTLKHIQANAFKLDSTFRKSQFDVAFSQGFFEHFSDQEVRSLVNQQLSVASRVVFSVPSIFYPTKDFGDERLLHKETWENILNTVGNVKAVYYCLQVLNGRRYPMHVLVAIDKNSHNDTL